MEAWIIAAAILLVISILSTVVAIVLRPRNPEDVMQQVIGDTPHMEPRE